MEKHKMSVTRRIEQSTGELFREMLPELATTDYSDKSYAEALALEIMEFTKSNIHDLSPENNLAFWGTAAEIAGQSDFSTDSESIFTQAASHKTIAVHNYGDGVRNEAHNISSTGKGALLVADDAGELVVAHLVRNKPVEKLYGDMAHPVTKKLVLAMLAERIAKQGADWGEGYAYITGFLRRNDIIGKSALPALGMATLHGVPFAKETAGGPRDPLAYSAGSAWTLGNKSAKSLMRLHSFNEHHKASIMESGVLEIDWLAGLADFTVARAAAELVIGRELSTNFPNPWQSDEWFGLAHDQINAN